MELSNFGKRGNSYRALGDGHDDLVTPILSLLYYVNSPYFYGNVDEEPIYKKKNLYSELLSDSNQDEGIKEILNTWTKENEEENDSLIETGMPMMFSGTKTIPRYSDDYNNMETIIFK
jgi:hypothetical protein